MRNIIALCGLMIAALLIPLPLLPQAYEGEPCSVYSNLDLKNQIRKGSVPMLEEFSRSYISTYQLWATSSLRPDTKKPDSKRPGEEDFEFTERVHKWTCIYTPLSARDGDTKTAWVEGHKDDGIGEILIVKIGIDKPVEIWAGIGASPDLFKANNRPRNVRLYVLAGKGIEAMPGVQFSLMQYKDLKVIAQYEIVLKDLNGYQPLPLPRARVPKDADVTFIAIEILSVYKGDKYSDTGISEIRSKRD